MYCMFVDKDVLHLPLSTSAEWIEKIKAGKLLNPTVPTLCLCKAGGRSMKAATLLAENGFTEVGFDLSLLQCLT
jgi:rhodanese-related sulfurtransferase